MYWLGHAALVGDKHKFACVLVSPNFPALEDWAKKQGIATGDRGALVKDAKVVAEYQGIVDKVNGTLAHYEDIKRVAVVPDEWSVEGGAVDAEHEAEAAGGREDVLGRDRRVFTRMRLLRRSSGHRLAVSEHILQLFPCRGGIKYRSNRRLVRMDDAASRCTRGEEVYQSRTHRDSVGCK